MSAFLDTDDAGNAIVHGPNNATMTFTPVSRAPEIGLFTLADACAKLTRLLCTGVADAETYVRAVFSGDVHAAALVDLPPSAEKWHDVPDALVAAMGRGVMDVTVSGSALLVVWRDVDLGVHIAHVLNKRASFVCTVFLATIQHHLWGVYGRLRATKLLFAYNRDDGRSGFDPVVMSLPEWSPTDIAPPVEGFHLLSCDAAAMNLMVVRGLAWARALEDATGLVCSHMYHLPPQLRAGCVIGAYVSPDTALNLRARRFLGVSPSDVERAFKSGSQEKVHFRVCPTGLVYGKGHPQVLLLITSPDARVKATALDMMGAMFGLDTLTAPRDGRLRSRFLSVDFRLRTKLANAAKTIVRTTVLLPLFYVVNAIGSLLCTPDDDEDDDEEAVDDDADVASINDLLDKFERDPEVFRRTHHAGCVASVEAIVRTRAEYRAML